MGSEPYGIGKNFFIKWLKTDYWIMNSDDTSKKKITRFNDKGFYESDKNRVIASEFGFNPDRKKIIGRVYILNSENNIKDDFSALLIIPIEN